ncbi:MAG: hypothetical protein HETSPECPRED_000727 [Heterodermia speciosa]|uniref:Uncharacterized protein n=1 Tax=Heterodermia speciosa TaxID=116794 RepID=A0A8H3IY72_9LECA|nr:MAG: hypothetical protein HETSPECPRED_000727 [Heterodermia speciosa]
MNTADVSIQLLIDKSILLQSNNSSIDPDPHLLQQAITVSIDPDPHLLQQIITISDMDSSPEDMRRRIASLEREVASQTRRKNEYRRNAETFERESIEWKRRAVSMAKKQRKCERALLDEMWLRYRSDRRALNELVALNNQVGALQRDSGASINRLQDTVRRLEGRVEFETHRRREEGGRLRDDIARLRGIIWRNGSVIERLHGDNADFQARIREHEATELTQLHQLNEQRSENADLKTELQQMKDAERSRRLSIQADPELAAIDARLEEVWYNGSYADDSGYEAAQEDEDESSGEPREAGSEQQVWLRPLRRMNLPPLRDGSVSEAIEGEEQQGEETPDSSPVMVLRGG